MCNRIEHCMHLRCAGISQTQYTDTWTCHLHRESRLTTKKDITTTHPSRPWSKHPTYCHLHHPHRFQRQQPTSGGTVRSSDLQIVVKNIPPNRFFDGFPDPGQFAAAKLTRYSSKPQRPSDSSRSWQRILLSGDVHPNPGPTTKYPCPVCYKSWGELFMQSLFWMGTFEVFWSSKRSRV